VLYEWVILLSESAIGELVSAVTVKLFAYSAVLYWEIVSLIVTDKLV
jgi:hypothetical protein